MEKLTKEEFIKKYKEDATFKAEVDKVITTRQKDDEDLDDSDLENVSGGNTSANEHSQQLENELGQEHYDSASNQTGNMGSAPPQIGAGDINDMLDAIEGNGPLRAGSGLGMF